MNRFSKKRVRKNRFSAAILSVFAAIFLLLCCCTVTGKTSVLSAKAEYPYDYGSDVMVIEAYDVQAEVKENRTVVFTETVTVYFTENLPKKASTFYRSLPIDGGDRYFDAWAKCEEIPNFSWNVADNPDSSDFIDINCVGGVQKNTRRTYQIGYTLLPKSKRGSDGMNLNVVGAGVMVPMHNVSVTVTFPGECTFADVHSNAWGKKGNIYVDEWSLSSDKRTLTMQADELPVLHNPRYDEYVAAGVTLEFACKGLKSYAATRMNNSLGLIIGAIVITALLGVGVFLICRKKKDIIKVVSVKPPKDMDPMRMGKLIDGKVDGEDVTSMIYYFAAQGYFKIDLSSESDPVLIRTEKPFPEDAPAHQRVLFKGLVKWGSPVKVSQLKNNFYTESDKANQLLSAKSVTRYERKSWIGFIAFLLLPLLLSEIVPVIVGRINLGGGYTFWGGPSYMIAMGIIGILLKCREDRRYKNKRRKTFWFTFFALLIAFVVWLIYSYLMPIPILSTAERIILFGAVSIFPFFSVKIFSLTDE
ncbi:MAG: DUF2207 domain-containing protein, partial [Clostridia bacterium]|nr:DUF2207 domain-containing protein [Clostridia bacterium]